MQYGYAEDAMFKFLKRLGRLFWAVVSMDKVEVRAARKAARGAAHSAAHSVARAAQRAGAQSAARRGYGVSALAAGALATGAAAAGAMYNRDWEVYGPLDEVSAEQLLDAGADPDLLALQARDAGYEGARSLEDEDCAYDAAYDAPCDVAGEYEESGWDSDGDMW